MSSKEDTGRGGVKIRQLLLELQECQDCGSFVLLRGSKRRKKTPAGWYLREREGLFVRFFTHRAYLFILGTQFVLELHTPTHTHTYALQASLAEACNPPVLPVVR